MTHRLAGLRSAGLVVAAALIVAACGTPTPYQAADKLGGQGYAELAIEDDRYRVSFVGNTLTSRETVEIYLLYRAAEVTVERGYDHFIMVDQTTEPTTTYRSTIHRAPYGFNPAVAFYPFHTHHGFYRPWGWGAYPTTATTRPVTRYTAAANILMREGPKPPDNPNAYDAHDVLARLTPVRPQP